MGSTLWKTKLFAHISTLKSSCYTWICDPVVGIFNHILAQNSQRHEAESCQEVDGKIISHCFFLEFFSWHFPLPSWLGSHGASSLNTLWGLDLLHRGGAVRGLPDTSSLKQWMDKDEEEKLRMDMIRYDMKIVRILFKLTNLHAPAAWNLSIPVLAFHMISLHRPSCWP